MAPVGMLCRDCSRGKPSHLYDVSPKILLIAFPVVLLAALFGGWLMYTISTIGFFGLIAGFLYGLGVGEITVRMTGRKRGWQIEVLAGVCVFLGLAGGYAIGLIAASVGGPGQFYAAEYESASGYRHAVLASFFLNPWMYASVALSIFGAVSRVRNVG